jgi:WD40 repeat protein/tRNA A-37 threonylcarbamoyl transferase component Bud32
MTEPSDNRSTETQLRSACAELEQRLRRGEPARAEEWLHQFPELQADVQSALDLIYAEYVVRRQLGEQLAPEEWYQRFPQWQPQLERQFQLHDLMDGDGSEATLVRAPARFTGTLPHQLHHYVLAEEIGRGATSMVFKGRDLRLGRTVAVKMVQSQFHIDSEERTRFQVEAEAVSRLAHPNIVQIYDVGEFEGCPYLVLEYLAGGSLAERMQQPRSPLESAQLIHTLALAVHQAHQHGIIHRDLKPANVLYSEEGMPKVADFGLAKFLDRGSGRTREGTILGTPSYMAPEQASGQVERVGTPADVYSLGAILYHLLTGQPPFGTDDYLKVLARVASEEPVAPRQLRPQLPRDLETICLKALEKEPARRYASAQELADELQRFLTGHSILARQARPPERLWKWARRRPAVAALVGVTVLALAVLLIGSFWHSARLQSALDQNRKQNDVLTQQVEMLQRDAFASQLIHVQVLAFADPSQALELLEDRNRCPPQLRDFTWRLWRYRCERLVHQFRQDAPVLAVAYPPDGQLLASASADGVIKLWDMNKGTLKHTFEARPSAVRCIVFLPPGNSGGASLASAGDEGDIHLWNLSSPRPVRTLEGGGSPILSLAVTPTGRLLASGASDGRATLWDVDRWERGARWSTQEGSAEVTPVRGLAFAPDGTELISANKGIQIWRISEGVPLLSLRRFESQSHSVAYSDSGSHIAMGRTSPGGILVIASPRTTLSPKENTLATFAGHFPTVHHVAFFPDGQRLLAASTEKKSMVGSHESTLAIWNVEAKTRELVLSQPMINAAALAPDGLSVASAGQDHVVRVWRLPDPTRRPKTALAALLATSESAHFSPDGRTVVLLVRLPGPTRKYRVDVWDQYRQQVRNSFEQEGMFLAHSPRRDVLAFWVRNQIWLRNWSTNESRCLDWIQSTKEKTVFETLAFSPDGTRLACALRDESVILSDLHGKHARFSASVHRGAQSLAYSPDGRQLAIGTFNGPVLLWDAETGAERAVLSGHTDHVNCLLFTGDGKSLISGSRDRSVKIWDLARGEARATVFGFSEWVNALSVSPDGRTLAAASGVTFAENNLGELMLCDSYTGQVRSIFREHRAPLAFSPDGITLLVGTRMGMAQIRTQSASQTTAGR